MTAMRDFLVTMTTRVPDGTPDAAVEDIRGREAARSRQLVAQGNLLRLWRPPLQPGEWRTLGLFAARDDEGLEAVLASMPLRVWRTDDVVALGPHPNDPGHTVGDGIEGVELLTAFIVAVPPGTPRSEVDDRNAREAQRAHELAQQGKLLRLWTLSTVDDTARALGLWQVESAAELGDIVATLPLTPWMAVETTPLTAHPSDPARGADPARTR